MASALLGSLPIASSITTGDILVGGSCWRNKKYASKNYPGSYASRASWNENNKLPKEHYQIMKSPQNNLKHHKFKSIEGIGSKSVTTAGKSERKHILNATSAGSHESGLQDHHVSKGISVFIKDAMDVFFKFSRPYVTIAATLGPISASVLAMENLSDLSPAFFISLFQYIAACYFMLIYHIGLNELVDVEIDKINKPHFALASGEYSSTVGVFVAALSLFTSLGVGWIVGSRPMLWGLLASCALGTAYSANLPLLRWKRFTPLTLVYSIGHPIITSNLAAFLHMKTHVLKRAAILPKSMIFTLAIMGAYYVVIGLAKDIPDVEGDKAGGIHTLAVRIGADRVLWFCVSLLEMAYGAAMLVGATSPLMWTKVVMVLAHFIKALVLWNNAKSLDLKSKAATQSFYMNIFKLHCAEAIIIALARI